MVKALELDADAGDATNSAIVKTARVLRVLSQGDVVRLSDVADAAGLARSTTHRILSDLNREGVVSRFGRMYRLDQSWSQSAQSNLRPEHDQLRAAARRHLEWLFERSMATVHLAVLDGDDVLYLEKITAPGGTSIRTHVGARLPATCTALGKSMLAHVDNVQLRRVLGKRLPVCTRHSIGAAPVLLTQLQKIRDEGVSYDRQEVQEGLNCVAAPVFMRTQMIAALSITRFGRDAIKPNDALHVRTVATRIADLLNYGAVPTLPSRPGSSV